MIVFEKASPENTRPTLEIAIAKAKELKCDIVLSTNEGNSARTALAIGREMGFEGKVIAITAVYGMKGPGENAMTEETRKQLEADGVVLVTAAHALSGAERSISGKFSGTYPVEVMAHTLRLLSQGVKVCVEIGAMAMDAGKLPYGKPAVFLGGTGRGLDTACVMTAGYTAAIFNTRIHEVLCKPW